MCVFLCGLQVGGWGWSWTIEKGLSSKRLADWTLKKLGLERIFHVNVEPPVLIGQLSQPT